MQIALMAELDHGARGARGQAAAAAAQGVEGKGHPGRHRHREAPRDDSTWLQALDAGSEPPAAHRQVEPGVTAAPVAIASQPKDDAGDVTAGDRVAMAAAIPAAADGARSHPSDRKSVV